MLLFLLTPSILPPPKSSHHSHIQAKLWLHTGHSTDILSPSPHSHTSLVSGDDLIPSIPFYSFVSHSSALHSFPHSLSFFLPCRFNHPRGNEVHLRLLLSPSTTSHCLFALPSDPFLLSIFYSTLPPFPLQYLPAASFSKRRFRIFLW